MEKKSKRGRGRVGKKPSLANDVLEDCDQQQQCKGQRACKILRKRSMLNEVKGKMKLKSALIDHIKQQDTIIAELLDANAANVSTLDFVEMLMKWSKQAEEREAGATSKHVDAVKSKIKRLPGPNKKKGKGPVKRRRLRRNVKSTPYKTGDLRRKEFRDGKIVDVDEFSGEEIPRLKPDEWPRPFDVFRRHTYADEERSMLEDCVARAQAAGMEVDEEQVKVAMASIEADELMLLGLDSDKPPSAASAAAAAAAPKRGWRDGDCVVLNNSAAERGGGGDDKLIVPDELIQTQHDMVLGGSDGNEEEELPDAQDLSALPDFEAVY